MAAFLIIFASALLGYAHASPFAWPATALSLMLVSCAKHYYFARKAVEVGLGDVINRTLLISTANALAATGSCYWAGVIVRNLSGL
jgi:hypothetical protein